MSCLKILNIYSDSVFYAKLSVWLKALKFATGWFGQEVNKKQTSDWGNEFHQARDQKVEQTERTVEKMAAGPREETRLPRQFIGRQKRQVC